ncbi:MAG: hypothetical protein U0X20_23685 [Caldilineaceae bacterium]
MTTTNVLIMLLFAGLLVLCGTVIKNWFAMLLITGLAAIAAIVLITGA